MITCIKFVHYSHGKINSESRCRSFHPKTKTGPLDLFLLSIFWIFNKINCDLLFQYFCFCSLLPVLPYFVFLVTEYVLMNRVSPLYLGIDIFFPLEGLKSVPSELGACPMTMVAILNLRTTYLSWVNQSLGSATEYQGCCPHNPVSGSLMQ